MLSKYLRLAVAVASAAACTVIVSAAPSASATPAVTRLSGADRIATAIAVSTNAFPSHATAAVLARSDDFADALAGTPLAVAKNAPLLLTPPTTLDARVSAELQRVVPAGGTVYLLGGTVAL